jgi:hypothetical protein
MATRVTRAEKLLTAIAKRYGLTDAGKKCLVNMFDLFHDTEIEPAAYPDGVASRLIPEIIPGEYTVQSPWATTAGQLWDLYIFDMQTVSPFYAASTTYATSISTSGVTALQPCTVATIAASNTTYMGGIFMVAVYAGQSINWINLTTTTGQQVIHCLTSGLFLDPSYWTGKHRVTAKGFEVYNTSNEFVAQGSVLSACFASGRRKDAAAWTFTDSLTAPTKITTTNTVFSSPLPTNSNQIRNYPNSTFWKAKEGIYMMSRLNDLDIPINYNDGTSLQFAPQNGIHGYGECLQVLNENSGVSCVVNKSWTNHEMNVCLFQGLAPGTTLAIATKIQVERFPGLETANLPLLTITKRAPAYDPIFFELYDAVIDSMPCGVPVSENGFGDWFADAVGSVSSMIHPIASMIPSPMGQGVAALTGMISGTKKAPPAVQAALSKVKAEAVKIKNEEIRQKNEQIRKKNEELRNKKGKK